jgi:hypothetical protein
MVKKLESRLELRPFEMKTEIRKSQKGRKVMKQDLVEEGG